MNTAYALATTGGLPTRAVVVDIVAALIVARRFPKGEAMTDPPRAKWIELPFHSNGKSIHPSVLAPAEAPATLEAAKSEPIKDAGAKPY